MVPAMYTLHVFDWKCLKCGKRTYQGRTPLNCPDCDNTTKFERRFCWQPRWHKRTEFWIFDSEPHFQYANQMANMEERKKEEKI
jgi:ribosomal protein L37E